jgi:uncharacterized protein (DUF2164 family)
MAQKTAMQELIHDFKHGRFNKLTNAQIDKELERYLVKEKEQIVNAVDAWVTNGSIKGEQYYNETFKK